MLGRGRPRHPAVLTPAEERVLALVREGKTNSDIAETLGLSPNTVKYHVANMLAKLNLPDRRALAAWRGDRTPGRRRALVALGMGLGATTAALAIVAVLTVIAADDGEATADPPILFAVHPGLDEPIQIYVLDPVDGAVLPVGQPMAGFKVEDLRIAPDANSAAFFLWPPMDCPTFARGCNLGYRNAKPDAWLVDLRTRSAGVHSATVEQPALLRWESGGELAIVSGHRLQCLALAAAGGLAACSRPLPEALDLWTIGVERIAAGAALADPAWQIGLDAQPAELSISPDGSWLAWVDGRSGQRSLAPIPDLSQRPLSDVVAIQLLATGHAAAWSPDSERLAFLDFDTSHCPEFSGCPAVDAVVLKVYDIASDQTLQLTGPGHVRAFAWSPDGERIAFISDIDDERGEIYVVDRYGSNLRRLTSNDLWETALAWAPEQ